MKKSVASMFAPKPTVEQAQASVVDADDALVAAGTAVEQAQSLLEAAHDSGNAEAVPGAEASLVAAKAERDRAEERQRSARRRLQTAITDRKATERASGLKRLKAACRERSAAAVEIDAAYTQLGAAIKRLNAADDIVTELHRIASPSAVSGTNYGPLRVHALLAQAAAKHGLPNSTLPGRDPTEIPTTVEAIEYDSGTILLDLE